MSRKSSGLRNRYRSGRGTYSIAGKSSTADRYGTWRGGVQETQEIVAGRTLPLLKPRREGQA